MRPLDVDTIKDIMAVLKGAETPINLYALETAAGVMITNQQLLLEWPHDRVEPCKALDKLIAAQTKEGAWPERMRELDWRSSLIAHSDFLPYDEDEMNEEEKINFCDPEWNPETGEYGWKGGVIVVPTYNRRIYYNPTFLAIIEAAFFDPQHCDPPELVLYEEVREDKHPLVLLTVFDDGALVGVCCNLTMKSAEVVAEDPETGKAAVVMKSRR